MVRSKNTYVLQLNRGNTILHSIITPSFVPNQFSNELFFPFFPFFRPFVHCSLFLLFCFLLFFFCNFFLFLCLPQNSWTIPTSHHIERPKSRYGPNIQHQYSSAEAWGWFVQTASTGNCLFRSSELTIVLILMLWRAQISNIFWWCDSRIL